MVGKGEGIMVGILLGVAVGERVGSRVGLSDGVLLGDKVVGLSETVGDEDGRGSVGTWVGIAVGKSDGAGDAVGN